MLQDAKFVTVKYGRSEDEMFYRYKYKNGVFLLFEDSEITDGECFVCTKKNEDVMVEIGNSQPIICPEIEPNDRIVTFEELKFHEETFR